MERSQEINELAAALCMAQGDFPNVPKDANNPFFKSKYADLAGIVDVVRPVLKKHNLCFSQFVSMSGSQPAITTMLLHKSGQFVADTLPMPVSKPDAQGIGSAITYGRRYGLQAILGLAAEDDDGNAASHSAPASQQQRPVPQAPTPPPPAGAKIEKTITQPQAQRLWAIANGNNLSKEEVARIVKGFGFNGIAQITMAKYEEICAALKPLTSPEEVQDDDIPF
jgi:hypothetical protein